MALLRLCLVHCPTDSDLQTMKQERLTMFFVRLLFSAAFLALMVRTGAGAPKESPHGDMKHACAECHNADSWVTHAQDFNHAATGFALQGSHAGLSCRQCHADMKFTQIPSNCVSCHTDVHQASLGLDCQRCHEPTTWNNEAQMRAAHQSFRFPLAGPHANLECFVCHKGNNPAQYVGTAAECQICHAADYRSVTEPNHAALGFPSNCTTCHPSNRSAWRPANFDHQTFDFPLTGAHQQTRCIECHTANTFAGTSSLCNSCHAVHYNATQSPNHLEAGIATTCGDCHTTTAWQPASFDHQTTDYPLTGRHSTAKCIQCHDNNLYAGAPTVCLSCHQEAYNQSENPSHKTLGYPTACDQCHSTAGWRPSSFDHQTTSFPLTGVHSTTSCVLCHVNGQFAGTTTQCSGCHQSDYNNSANPPHLSQGYPTTCNTCHSTSGWRPSTFDHQNTDFPLTGLHTTTTCLQCHVGGQFEGTPTECLSCHQTAYNNSVNPPHLAQGYPTTCNTCHSTSGWRPSTFNHANTDFPLTGVHTTATCLQCHIGGQFEGTPTQCFSCHADDFNGASNPNHVLEQFPHSCQDCHSTTAWIPWTITHAQPDAFPIYGGTHRQGDEWNLCSDCHNIPANFVHFECILCHEHRQSEMDDQHHGVNGYQWVSTACYTCHPDGRSGDLTRRQNNPALCVNCHLDDYNSSVNPPHLTQGYPTTCVSCHTSVGWRPSSFNHQNTDFPLTGVHTTTSCVQCHANGQFEGTPTQCLSCHQTDYDNSANPPHVAQGYPTTCNTCHSTSGWQPSTFDHQATNFPLTGAHVTATCLQCHANGQFPGTPSACFACHETDYQNASTPNHVQQGFPQMCQTCHTTAAWTPSSWNHASTGFPLTGQHVSASCLQCHVGGVFPGTPTDCFSCHQTDFNSASNPNHVVEQFPHSCEDCHNTNGWEPWTFNHVPPNAIPIYTGRHQQGDEWDHCYDCHNIRGDFDHFECILCHEHRQSEMDNDHDEVNGYQWVFTACYACHPDGNNPNLIKRRTTPTRTDK